MRGGRAGGLPGDEELHREAWGEEQVKPRSTVRQTVGREICVNLSSQARKILQLWFSVSFILTFT